MVVVVIVVDGGTIVVLLGVSEGLLGAVRELWHEPFMLIWSVMSTSFHRVFVVTMETTVMHGAVIEVLRVVVVVMTQRVVSVVHVYVVHFNVVRG